MLNSSKVRKTTILVRILIWVILTHGIAKSRDAGMTQYIGCQKYVPFVLSLLGCIAEMKWNVIMTTALSKEREILP
jgi:hypothetical protein